MYEHCTKQEKLLLFGEMNRMKMDILGISEVKWPGVGEMRCEDGCFIYSGGDQAIRGVGVLMSQRVDKCLKIYWTVSDRVTVVKIRGMPFDISKLQVYAPTGDRNEDEVDEFCDTLDQAI